MKTGKTKANFVVLSVVSAVIVGFIVVLGLALSDDFVVGENLEDANNTYSKISKSLLLNEEVVLNKDELNAIITDNLEKNEGLSKKIENITIIPSSQEDLVDVYARVIMKGKALGLKAKAKITFDDGKFKVEVLKTKLGKLKVSRKMVLNKIKNKLGDKIEIEDSTVYFTPNLNVNLLGKKVNLQFERCKVENEQVAFKLKIKNDKNIIN